MFQTGGGFLASPIDPGVALVAGADAIMSSVWIFDIVVGILVLVGLVYVAKKASAMKAEAPATDE